MIVILKKLMGIAWDMWDHRNKVLHENPERRYLLDDVEAAKQAIHQEFERGEQGILRQDRFPFRSKTATLGLSLVQQ